MLDLPNFIIY